MKKVALIFGGKSAEHDVSLVSAASIHKNLDPRKFDVISLYVNPEGEWRIVESPFLSKEELNGAEFRSFLPWTEGSSVHSVEADIYFPVLHGPNGEDGTIQGLFEMADVPYVGAGVLASSICMDKVMAKKLFQINGLPTAQHLALDEEDWLKDHDAYLRNIAEALRLPVFVKPANLGSSIGISKVSDTEGLRSAINLALNFDRKVLIEEGISGRELECSVLGDRDARASLPGELIPNREFYDYRDKYIEGKTRFIIPAKLPDSRIGEIQEMAVKAYKALACSGMARVDFFLEDGTGALFLNEINTIPGFTEISMYPKLWEVSGVPFPELLETLIALGLSRHREKKRKGYLYRP